MGSETNEIVGEFFESLLQRYQEGLEKSIRKIEFIFDSVDVLYFNINKLSPNRGGSHIDSPEWLKNKKSTVNPKNNDDKCFLFAVTMALKVISKEY